MIHNSHKPRNNSQASRRHFLVKASACVGAVGVVGTFSKSAIASTVGTLPAITSILLDDTISVGTFSGNVPIPPPAG